MSTIGEIHRQQVVTNLATIVEYLWRIPGVTHVEVENHPMNDEEVWDKKVWVKFAGCDEPIVLEMY